MALIKCPDCGHNVSDKAQACIQCGCPLGSEGFASLHSPEAPHDPHEVGVTHRKAKAKIYTTQKTGKDVKIMALIGWGLLGISAICLFDATPGVFLVFLLTGIATLVLSAVISWWKYS